MSSIIIVKDSFDDLTKALGFINAADKKICIITDDNLAELYLKEVSSACSVLNNSVYSYSIKPGEESKSIDTIINIYDFLIQNQFNRDDLILALGGGVVGDIAGFAASTYKRGLRFIQVPTTLLAQVDSAIGGKNGCDYDTIKNVIGTFYQPSLVYVNKKTTDSLPSDEVSNGRAELIKTGVISGNVFEPGIEECLSFKKMITDEDPYDEHKRNILNFGHTLGHAIEAASAYKYKHGVCVGLGMICAFEISVKRGWLSTENLEELKTVLKRNGLLTKIKNINPDAVLDFCYNDKKIRDGKIRFILLRGLGNPIITDDVSRKEMIAALETINEKG
ncbi:MAG: 3-dehydroquinate synthase family protein [Lachnospiraceae bacterium]|nr:3-dehydroquinate synthase family protein [Lachnospiraceae bacterium]